MQFNINKCKALSVDRGNPQYRYIIINEALLASYHEKDIGVRVTSDLSLGKQSIEARNKANMVLGYMFRSVKSRSRLSGQVLWTTGTVCQGWDTLQ